MNCFVLFDLLRAPRLCYACGTNTPWDTREESVERLEREHVSVPREGMTKQKSYRAI